MIYQIYFFLLIWNYVSGSSDIIKVSYGKCTKLLRLDKRGKILRLQMIIFDIV